MDKKDLGKTSLGMEANLAGLLCYLLGFITGIIFYLLEKENKFVRFNAMQSMLAFGGLLVLQIVIGIIPVINLIALPLLGLLSLVLWIVMMIKAFQGEKFKLPIVGDIAEKNS